MYDNCIQYPKYLNIYLRLRMKRIAHPGTSFWGHHIILLTTPFATLGLSMFPIEVRMERGLTSSIIIFGEHIR